MSLMFLWVILYYQNIFQTVVTLHQKCVLFHFGGTNEKIIIHLRSEDLKDEERSVKLFKAKEVEVNGKNKD